MPRPAVQSLPIHSDARGLVVEPLGPDELPAQANVHLVTTEPGATRGNHYHERGTEVLTVIGPALVRTRVRGEEPVDTPVPDGAVLRFVFPPLVSHAIRNTGERTNVLVAFSTTPHDPERPDVVRDVILEP